MKTVKNVAAKKVVAAENIKRNARVIKLPANIIEQSPKWSAEDKIKLIREGFSKIQLEVFKKETALDYETLAKILGVTKATLHNKKGTEKFSPAVSERLMVLADIFAEGYDVFGDKEHFNTWLVSPIRALGNTTPVSWLDTHYGAEEIKNVIGRIAWGVFA